MVCGLVCRTVLLWVLLMVFLTVCGMVFESESEFVEAAQAAWMVTELAMVLLVQLLVVAIMESVSVLVTADEKVLM